MPVRLVTEPTPGNACAMSFNKASCFGILFLSSFAPSCVSNEVTFPTRTPATLQACLGTSIDELYRRALDWRTITGLDPATIEVRANTLPPEDMRRFFYVTATSRHLETAIARSEISLEKTNAATTFNKDVYFLALHTIGAKRDGECTCEKMPSGRCGILEGISR